MIELEKTRLQTEVKCKLSEMSQKNAEINPDSDKINFIKKFFNFKKDEVESEIIPRKVLVCEDDILMTKLLRRFLEAKGLNVTTTVSPIFFADKKLLLGFDFIITDNQMPYMHGTQFVDYVEKELQMNVPMYIHSGDCDLKNKHPITKVLREVFVKGAGFDSIFKKISEDLNLMINQQRV